MRSTALCIWLLATSVGPAQAQWILQNSGTTADLRGIDSAGAGVAWASGTNGTVLRTEDGGYLWQRCTIPPGAGHLDFRGVQAFDANTAIIMSSGKGDLSRLYKTTDGCQTWKLIFTNPDPDGFWDALHHASDGDLYVLGDPVQGVFALFVSQDSGTTWHAARDSGREAVPGDGSFAASNSELASDGPYLLFGTGGSPAAHVYLSGTKCSSPPVHPHASATSSCTVEWSKAGVPVGSGTASSGVFSIAVRPFTSRQGVFTAIVVAVGGSYDKPDDASRTAAFSTNAGKLWTAAQTLPHGYRSSVAYDPALKAWIAVGPNGTDISTDDGRNWHAVHPQPALHQPAGSSRDWNAVSLPFVVGPRGRIGLLDPQALTP